MIDIRSDTVTRPAEAMRQAMAAAEVGGDNPAMIAGVQLRCVPALDGVLKPAAAEVFSGRKDI